LVQKKHKLTAKEEAANPVIHLQISMVVALLQNYLGSASGVAEPTHSDFKVPAHAHEAPSAAQFSYIISITAVVLIVSALYAHKGLLIVSRILVYLFALSTITLTVKNVYVSYSFNFPRFLSALHLFVCGVIAFSILLYRQRAGVKPIKAPSRKDFVGIIVPIAMALSFSIVVNNIALSYMGAGLVEMVSGCSPVFVFFIGAVTTQSINYNLLCPVIVVCFGTAMCAEGELRFSLVGLGLAFVATFLRAIKSTMQHALMSGEDARMDPVELLAWLAIPALVIMQVWSIVAEGKAPYAALYQSSSVGFFVSLAVSCVNAAILNFANMFVVRDLGAIGVNMVAQLKGILIILGGVAMLGEMVNYSQCAGYSIIVFGVFWFNNVEEKEV
jgi:drug/metabolite transporter (DMT)-like permease